MSKRSKLEKFADNQRFSNVFENFEFDQPQLYAGHNQPVHFKGDWSRNYFLNDFPLILELACGRGEYSLGLSKMYHQINIIGIDIKGARIWKGATQSQSLENNRVAFIRSKIELIDHYFNPGEVSEIWITFPDPFPRNSKSNRRLISNYFLKIYANLITIDGLLHLKTDDDNLFEFALEELKNSDLFELQYSNSDIYSSELFHPALEIKTYYEKMHLELGRKIKYIQARKIRN